MEKEIIKLAAQLFKVDEQTLNGDTTYEEVATWTSFAHIALIGRIEESLGIVIPIENVPKIKKLSDFIKYSEGI